MDEFPLKLNEWINAFVAHNWLAVSVLLAILAGLKERFKDGRSATFFNPLYDIARDAWKVVRPPSEKKTPTGGENGK